MKWSYKRWATSSHLCKAVSCFSPRTLSLFSLSLCLSLSLIFPLSLSFFSSLSLFLYSLSSFSFPPSLPLPSLRQFSLSESQKFTVRGSSPRIMAYPDFDMPFLSSEPTGAGSIFLGWYFGSWWCGNTSVCEQNIPFTWASALQSSGRNCSPAPDPVFSKLVSPPVF